MFKHYKKMALLLMLIQGEGFLMAQHLMHYTSERFQYSMLLPEEWKRSDQLKNSNISLVMISPDDAAVAVSFYELNKLSEAEFINGYIQSTNSKNSTYQLTEKGAFMSKDDEAAYLVFQYSKDSTLMKEKVCFYQRKEEMAVVSARQIDRDFHLSAPVFDKIFRSFTFETLQEKVEAAD